MSPGTQLWPAEHKSQLANRKDYQSRIGSIMFPMCYTRPDIAFSTGRLQSARDNSIVAFSVADLKIICLGFFNPSR